MLIKIDNFDLTTPASSTIDFTLYEADGSTLIDISTLDLISAFSNMLILENLTTNPVEKLTIASFAFKTDGTDGSSVLTFDSSATVTSGDILSLRQGIETKTTPLSRLMNSASISTGATGTNTANSTESFITPVTQTTAPQNYTLSINLVSVDGVNLTTTEYNLADPFTVNGTPVASVTLVLVDPINPHDTNSEVEFTVTYKNELGEELTIDPSDTSAISAYLRPTV